MGVTHATVRVANPADPRRAVEQELMIDSGALYAVVPAPVLRRLGIRPHGTKTFTLADGSHVEREVGSALFVIGRAKGASTVIFGRRGDACLLGIVTLEELGLMLDPLKRELRPLPMMLA
jgi:predicted aspartyl protease